MESRWSDKDAQSAIDAYADYGEDIALRVYTSHLIGAEKSLVLHGGGNTSVKSRQVTVFGDTVDAIYVKGSGWSLDSIEPEGFPGLDLKYLLRLRDLDALTDEEMVNQLRTHLFKASAPTPSIETLLHAFLPYKFIDHSHADAILTLTNQPHGEDLIREALGDDIPIVPYVMPGFALSKVAAETLENATNPAGLVLHKHGLFTFGETARDSYERHIDLVSRAEALAQARAGGQVLFPVPSQDVVSRKQPPKVSELAPLLRGALREADPEHRHWLLCYRVNEQIWNAAWSDRIAEVLDSGPLTPDHIIRTKEKPLIIGPFDEGDRASWPEQVRAGINEYVAAYNAYFDRQIERTGRDLKRLDPLPRVIVVRNFGVFTVGKSVKDAGIVADIFEHTLDVKSTATVMDRFEPLPEDDLFDVEYWSLEQAKLAKGKEKPLQRKVALVTGAAGAIGQAVVRHLCADGANVVATDIDMDKLQALGDAMNAQHGPYTVLPVQMDVTDAESVDNGIRRGCAAVGGIDITVLNAGVAVSAPIDALELDDWYRVLNVNLNGYFTVLRAVTKLLKNQGTGGNIIINASKNVFAPGAEFAAYSASKAGGHQLGKVAAIELAPFGIRVNMVNADGIFNDGEIPSGLWSEVGPGRAKAKGISMEELEEYYRNRNLLKSKITADDVARSVLFFAREETPTTGATLPVDGGVPAAFPR